MAAIEIPYPQAIRAVFFDVGYTLLAPHPTIIEMISAICARHGIALDTERLSAALPQVEEERRLKSAADPWIWGDEQAIDAMWAWFYRSLLQASQPFSEAELDTVVRDLTAEFDRAGSYTLYPDVIPVLRALRAHGMTLGVISDWGMSLALILQHHDLTRYFDFAVISAQIRHAKPDPALFHTALTRADAIPDYALHIGDSYLLDVLGARAAGITPILLDRAARYDTVHLDCLITHDLFGLLDLLEIARPAITDSRP